jgi:hypothetical protein
VRNKETGGKRLVFHGLALAGAGSGDRNRERERWVPEYTGGMLLEGGIAKRWT